MTASHILCVFPGFVPGGAQLRFVALANHFGARFRYTIMAMDGRLDAARLLNADLDISLATPDSRKGDTLGNLSRFRRSLRELKPDLLLTHNWGSIEWALANQPGLVRHIHIEDGFGPEEAAGQLRRRVWTRRLALRGSLLVVPSHLLEDIALRVWKLAPRKVRHIANGIDCDRFERPADRAPNAVPVIGTVAALRPEKNIARLIEAFALTRVQRSCRLAIAGDGPERTALEARAAALGVTDDVTFLGHRSDTERVYAGLDIFALSSDTEQMPLSVIEAMAASLPVASTDVGDVGRMLAAENAPLIAGKDAPALARQLEQLLDPALAARTGAANRSAARTRFTQDSMFAAYGALFEG